MKKLAIRLISLGLVISTLVLVSCEDAGAGSEEIAYKYFPTTNAELKDAVNKEIAAQGDNADLNIINTSGVTDMSNVFLSKTTFNGDVSRWDVSKVTTFQAMFSQANAFNGDLSKWQIGKNLQSTDTINMGSMFSRAKVFNRDLSAWDVSKVTNMDSMFHVAEKFNSDIKDWDVSKVTKMGGMFGFATAFNQNLEKWGTKIGYVNDWYGANAIYIFQSSGLEGKEPSWCKNTIVAPATTRCKKNP